jgi:predicted nuclease of predicted toxin-antitoxin system
MTWPLYMDHHVPWAVTSALRLRGYDVLTAAEDHSSDRDDHTLLARATQQGRIFVTQDRDLLALAKSWRDQGQLFCGIVFTRQQQLSYAELIEWLELIASGLREDEVRNQVIFVPMR